MQVPIAEFAHLPTHCKFLAFMPQWDFLDFLAARGKRYPAFHLWMRAEVVGLIEEAGRVVGVEVMTPEGKRDVRADLVVGADGRHSTVRERAGLPVQELGAPMDVLWFGISRTTERSGGEHGPLRSRPHLRHHQPRALLAVRVCHSERQRGAPAGRRASRPSARRWRRPRRGRETGWASCEPGTT